MHSTYRRSILMRSIGLAVLPLVSFDLAFRPMSCIHIIKHHNSL